MRRIITKCAALHMTVTFHNVMEPTGLQRTYPNYRTSEAVLNLEYNKWDPIGSNAEHELTVPFIRMLAGPLDFHQGGFRSVLPQDFKPHNIAPVVMGTRCHQMAMYVVYEDALPMIVDYPEAYQGQEGFDFICGVPTTWDQTRVIDGTVGQELTIARRKGEEWYIGSMAGPSACELKIALSFLPGGAIYDAQIWADDPAQGPNAAAVQKRPVTSSDTLEIKMSIDGGHVIRLIPRGKTPE
jgi:alpha-glucosidase